MDLLTRIKGNLTEYQSIPFWSWNDRLECEELRQQIRAMKEAGIGGFFMHARGGLSTPYMGEEWFEAVDACINEAEKQGMHAWCYDENGWPSGFAGMKLLEDSANWVHYITCEKKAEFDGDALAVYVLEGTSLRRVWKNENAAEYICIYDKTNSSVVDILNPEIVQKFLKETHEKYYERFGDKFGKSMQGFFTDEPQYFRPDTGYSPMVIKAYRERYGEDILDTLGALFIDCDEAPRLRYRYWRLMNELYINGFVRQVYEWCDAHGCKLTGHSVEETCMRGQMYCSAGVMPFYEYEHIPGIDSLGREPDTDCLPRQVSSVAQQLGKKHVLTETFAGATWAVTPVELKRMAEWQYVNGANQMCQHLYPYSIRGQRKRDWPAFFSNHCPWVKDGFRAFNDYFTTIGYMLSESREDAKVAVIHPIHDSYLVYKRNEQDGIFAADAVFEKLVAKLSAAGIVHHYVDEWLLERHGGTNGAKLRMGKCEYEYVVLPEMDTIDRNTACVLKEYLANGGKLYLEGKAPTMIEGEKADLSFLKSNIAFEDLRFGRVRVEEKETILRYTVREAEFGDFVYAVNLDTQKICTSNLRIRAKGAKLFNAMERRYEPVYFEKDGEDIIVPLSLEPVESCILILDDDALPAQKKETAQIKTILPEKAKVIARSENILVLDTVALSYDGETFEENLPVMLVSDRLLREKTNRTIYLKYCFKAEELPNRIRIEKEKMGTKRAWFNGAEIQFCDLGTLDAAFVSADIAGSVKPGFNELLLEIDYYQEKRTYDIFNDFYYDHTGTTESLVNCLSYDTDIENVYVMGDFAVYAAGFAEGEELITKTPFVISKEKETVHPACLAEEGYPFFGGRITLEVEFEAEGNEREIRLPGNYHAAKVRVNGRNEQLLLFGKKANVEGMLQKGKNSLVIELITGCRNLYGPFHVREEGKLVLAIPESYSGYGKWKDHAEEYYTPDYKIEKLGVNAVKLI
ncbi:MAG: hypothetical protein E7335_01240 [Clostridiales bacterium]|nr:hypothetical protein [Clostridiales bacterium]